MSDDNKRNYGMNKRNKPTWWGFGVGCVDLRRLFPRFWDATHFRMDLPKKKKWVNEYLYSSCLKLLLPLTSVWKNTFYTEIFTWKIDSRIFSLLKKTAIHNSSQNFSIEKSNWQKMYKCNQFLPNKRHHHVQTVMRQSNTIRNRIFFRRRE